MRFARQKLLIALCLLAIPPTGVLALLETPELSTLVLKFSLKFARLRTGLKIDASAWHVSPLTFSAKLEGVKLSQGRVSLHAPRVEVWVSPVAILVGRLHFSEVEVADAKLAVDRPDFLSKNPFEKDAKDPPSKFWKTGEIGEDYPKLFGTTARDAFALLHKRNIDFDDLRLTNIDVDMGALHVKNFNFLVNNLQEGQLRAEWDLASLDVTRGIEGLEKFRGALSLLKTRESGYQLYIGAASLSLPHEKETILRLRGAWPGEVVADVKTDLPRVEAWLKGSPWFKKQQFQGHNAGSLQLSATAKIVDTRLADVKADVESKGLIFEDFYLNEVVSKVNFSFKDGKLQWSLPKFEVQLPVVKGVDRAWRNRLVLSELNLEGDNVKSVLQFDEASLCGVLIAASEKECQVGVAFTGPLKVEGSLNPLRLKIEPEFKVSAGPVMSDPYITPKSEPIVQLKPGKLSGIIQAHEKYMVFEKLKMIWQDKHEISAEGTMEYVPTRLRLKVKTSQARLDEILGDLVGLHFGGASDLEGQVIYDHSLERNKRTHIEATLRSPNFQFEGQDFGSISGPIRFEDRVLFLGPYQLRSGGGTALVQGSISPNEDRGSFLNLVVQANRFEFAAYSDETRKSESFRGFLSGRGTMSGFVDTTRNPNNGLRGDMNFRARNFKAFNIPFAEAELQALYENKDLKVQRLVARKDGARLSLKGILSPKGGSELTFDSEPIPLRNIEIEPKLAIFEKGLVEIEGFWRPSEGWEVKGNVQGASVAGQSLGVGSVKIVGTTDKIDLDLKFTDLMDVHYRGLYRKNELLIDRIEAKCKDAGIYAGLAYLGDWKQPMPVDGKGTLSFLWRPKEGYFETQDLKIFAPHSSESSKELVLDVPGTQRLVWNANGVVADDILWKGPASLSMSSSPGDTQVSVETDLPLGLVRLFLPAIDIRGGRAKLTGKIPLSPHFSTLSLQGKVSEGILKVPGVAGSLDGLDLDLDMQRSLLTLRRGSVRAGSGNVRISGVYRVDLDKPATDISLVLDGAQLVLLDDVPTMLNGEVHLRGEKLPYLMSGRVIVTEAMYGKEFGETTEEIEEASPDPAIGFDLDVELGSGTKVRNSVVASEVRGRLKILGNNIAPEMRGEMLMTNGIIYANQSEFSILQSRIQFYGAKENLPIVNVRANTTVRNNNIDYKIELNARGPADNLNIEFTSDPALSNQDIVSLLAFGVIRQDDEAGSTDLANAAQAEAFQAIFGRAIGNSLSKSTGFDVRLKASTSTTNGKSDNIPKVSVMRRLSERVTARFARSLDINNPEKDVQVDYRLLNNVNLSGVWESPTPEETSLGVDLRFRFEIE
ncbi:MAG: translocation/assembly module TamB domain-containing protein [Bdellovibrionota bacterium]